MLIHGEIGVEFDKIKTQFPAQCCIFPGRRKFNQRRHAQAHAHHLIQVLIAIPYFSASAPDSCRQKKTRPETRARRSAL
jgi:hypothetical protein